MKPEIEWTRDEIELANFNEKALNAILTAVDMNMFRLIANSTSAKDAWEILQRHCEGDQSVRESRLRMVTTRFENLRMEEEETISSYFGKIIDIANESQDLGEPISNKRLVSKALRSLPERFNVKISSIEEAHDTATLELTKLMSILKTFEMNLDQQKILYNKKGAVQKIIALKVAATEVASSASTVNFAERDEHVLEEIDESASMPALIQKYNAMVRFVKSKSEEKPKDQRNNTSDFSKQKQADHPSPQLRRVASDRFRNDPKTLESILCSAFSGFGHYANQCANTLRKYGNNIFISMSDDENDNEEEKEVPAEQTLYFASELGE